MKNEMTLFVIRCDVSGLNIWEDLDSFIEESAAKERAKFFAATYGCAKVIKVTKIEEPVGTFTLKQRMEGRI